MSETNTHLLLSWQEIDQAEDEYAFAKFGKW